MCLLVIILLFYKTFGHRAEAQAGDSLNPSLESGIAVDGFADRDALRRALGLSLGAATVYARESGFSYAGYSEIIDQKYSDTAHWHVTNLHPVASELPTNKDHELTLARGVLFLGYRFSDRMVFNSEIRIDRELIDRGVATFPEHYITTDTSVDASVDLAYIDYIMSPEVTFRAGIVLLPIGLINEFHDPQEVLGTRPGFGDLFTIPSIWHALGFGIAGHKWAFDYRAYVVSGLNAAGFTEFGLRGGREISTDTIGHPAAVVRLDYNPFPGGVLGTSYYIGNSGIFGLEDPVDLRIHTTVKELHGQLRWKGAFARAQYAKALLHSSTELNGVLGTTGLRGVGKRMVGGYVEGGWNFLWSRNNGTMVMPYMRGEATNPQDALPPPSLDLGLIKNHFLDFIIWTYGVEIRPTAAVSIKPEYISIHDQNQIFWKEFHLGVSYTF
jgi:hypothetical protein